MTASPKRKRNKRDPNSPEEKQAKWEAFQQAVAALYEHDQSFAQSPKSDGDDSRGLSKSRPPRIFMLILEGDLALETRLEPLLASAPLLARNLTKIRIEEFVAAPVLYVDGILVACKNLRELYLSSGGYLLAGGRFTPIELGVREESSLWLDNPPAVATRSMKLQRLTIKSLRITQKVMECLVRHCPLVTSLEVITAFGPAIRTDEHLIHSRVAPFDLEPLYRLIASELPLLTHIHVSFFYGFMRHDHARVFREVFSHVPSWSLYWIDLAPQNAAALLLPPSQASWSPGLTRLPPPPIAPAISPSSLYPILTSLEIQHRGVQSGLCETLQSYLVSSGAASLLHIKIPRHPFWLSYFTPSLLHDSGVWTCRGLQTLHLRISPRCQGTTIQPNWSTRVVFGYISRVVPLVTDLSVHVVSPATVEPAALMFALQGGMCLLKRMRKLEKIRVSSYTGAMTLGERDLAWLITEPTMAQKIQNRLWITELKAQMLSLSDQDLPAPQGKCPNVEQQLDSGGGSGCNKVDDYSNLATAGSLQDVIDCLEEESSQTLDEDPTKAAEAYSSLRCLPYLESLVLSRTGSHNYFDGPKVKRENTRLVKTLRSDIEFHMEGY
ncbi:hypothetical protein BGZ58_002561 [Dissophora ornata]|nr:hypothetical protein BGZ58_002561 [Dissophora ornata]